MRLPTHRPPIGPGEILKDFLDELGVTQSQLAEHLGWTIAKVSNIINGKRRVTTEIALCLADTFGNSAGFWMNAQQATDLYQAQQKHKKRPKIKQAS